MKRYVYFLSDSTGITVETLGHCLLSQFSELEFEQITMPYINSVADVAQIIAEINEHCTNHTLKPLVFTTFIAPEMRALLADCQAMVIDFFSAFMPQLQQELATVPTGTVGCSHSLHNYQDYTARIEAVNFALANDDGLNINNYSKADTILVGVSRCGKTPSCLYLALQFGIQAANYPLTEEDLADLAIPSALRGYQNKLFGLLIEPSRLAQIREQRFPNSTYATLAQCQKELAQAERLFKREGIPFINTTNRSIEEIATKILAISGIKRRLQ